MSDVEFPNEFRIGNRMVGGGHPVYIIAEGGVAHFGRFDLAEQLVDMAAAAQADAFKLQAFDVDHMITGAASEWKERLRPRMLDFDQFSRIRRRCRDAGLDFILTFHDPSLLGWIDELDLDAIKIGSGERNNTPFLGRLGSFGRPVIVSTGMCSIEDVDESVQAIAAGGCREVAALHCVTSYPTPPEQLNLGAMDAMRTVFSGPVGYSDHTEDHLASMAAVARGARIIEKHVTILRDVPNAQDWKVSCGPDDFPDYVVGLRRVEAMIGSGRKQPAACEAGAMDWALKSIVAAENLPAGHPLAEIDVAFKRPGTGLRPNRLSEILGRRLKTPMKRDETIALDNLE
jgi:N,N'-diacetyllegionaminate synthase